MNGKTGTSKPPWLRLFTDKWLWGSISAEFTLEQQAVFIKLLCLARGGLGDVDVTYPDTLAQKLLVPPEALKSTLKRSKETGRITTEYIRKEKRWVAHFTSWDHYQPEYLQKERKPPAPGKHPKEKTRPATLPPTGEKHAPRSTPLPRTGEGRGGEGIRGEGIGGEGSAPPTVGLDKDGMLPIPKAIPFKDGGDELTAWRAEIKRLMRLIARGEFQDGEKRISAEGVERMKVAFNNRVRDFLS